MNTAVKGTPAIVLEAKLWVNPENYEKQRSAV